MDDKYIEARTNLLKEKLLGSPIDETVDAEPEFYRNSAKKKEGVWIIPAEYESRLYPYYEVDHMGETYLSGTRLNIHALLLEPEKPRKKGIITLHQHAREFELGKSEVAGLKTGKSGNTQQYGLELAKKGYPVLCFDFLPFETRKFLPKNSEDYYWGERFAKQDLTMDGVEPMGIHVLDTMRAVDVLNKYGLSDIGVIGHSFGGMVSVYSAACDPRIKVGVSNCGISTFTSVNSSGIVHNWSWSVHDIMRFGEAHKLFELIAKRPFLISAANKDQHFPIEGVRKLHRLASNFYQDDSLLELYEFEGIHAFPEKARENAYRFLDEHL